MAAPMKKVKSTGKLVFEKSSFNDTNEKHQKCVLNHPFNFSVHVLLPELEEIPTNIDNLLREEVSYLARQVPLKIFLDPEFMHGFIKAGQLYMLSHGTCIDTEDCVALLPTGKLVLSLCKDTYQHLGLTGRPSTASKSSGKYVVEVDLCDSQFVPGSKLYDRVHWCLTNTLGLTFDLLVLWKPNDAKVCPSSIQNFFKANNYVCNRLKISKQTTKFTDFRIPVFTSDIHQPINSKNNGSCDYEEVFEWLGACSLGIGLPEAVADQFVSTLTCPIPSVTVKCAVGVQYTAMFSSQTVQSVINQLRSQLQSKNLPWCSITVYGFMDSPVAWQHDHGFHRNGDNLYTLVMFQNADYWQYSAIGVEDTCP